MQKRGFESQFLKHKETLKKTQALKSANERTQ